MRCKACDIILKESEIKLSTRSQDGSFEDLCGSCLEAVNVMKYTLPQEGPSEEFIIYPPYTTGYEYDHED